ncbi:MAG: phosphate ABC transporter substrate-binding/OmpA family protein [Myxococcota bacterium]
MRITMWIAFEGWLAGCATPPPPAPAPAPALVRVVGEADLLEQLVPALVDAYARSAPEAPGFALEPTGAAAGFRALIAGEADLVVSTRTATPAEVRRAKLAGFDPTDPEAEHLVGVDVVGVAVHPQNPIESLTFDQVVVLFCADPPGRPPIERVTSWAELGGDPIPVRVVAPDRESGARGLLENFFCGVRGFRPMIEVSPSDGLAAALRDDPSVVTIGTSSQGSGRLVALAVDTGFPPVRPTQDDVARGSYPLYGDVVLTSRGAPSPALDAFLRWVDDPDGQEVVDEQRFVPLFLRPTRLDEARPLREVVRFEPGASSPDARSQARLQFLVDEIRERQFRHVVLEGYTDDTEPDPFVLSEARARVVRDALAARVPNLYFEIIPRGPKNPIAPNHTPMGRMINRRVQVYLAEEEQPEP